MVKRYTKKAQKKTKWQKKDNTKVVTEKTLRRDINKLAEKQYFPAAGGSGNSFSTNYVAGIVVAPVRLSSVPQTTSPSTDFSRKGDQLQIRSLEFNYSIFYVGATITGNTQPLLRMIIFQWNNLDTTPPTANDILLNDTIPDEAMNSPYDHDRRYQFRILYDKVSQFSSQGKRSDNKRVKIINFPKRNLQFIAGGLNANNHLYYMVVANGGLTASSPLTLTLTWKLNFSDY